MLPLGGGSLLVLALAALLTFSLQAEPLRLTVVASESGGSYQEFGDALRTRLPPAQFHLNYQLAGETLARSDLYVAVGLKAATELAARDAPVLSVLVQRDSYERLQRGTARLRNGSRSAIYLGQPLERQISLLQAALPEARKIGVLYSAPPFELEQLRRLLPERNLRLYERQVVPGRPLSESLEEVLENSEVLFVMPDAEVYNPGTIRNILLTAYRRQIPLLGISQAYVKAGSLCAVYSTPEQIAVQAAGMLQRYAESGLLPAEQYPSDFEVSVNVLVARSLDLRLKEAGQLREVIGRPR